MKSGGKSSCHISRLFVALTCECSSCPEEILFCSQFRNDTPSIRSWSNSSISIPTRRIRLLLLLDCPSRHISVVNNKKKKRLCIGSLLFFSNLFFFPFFLFFRGDERDIRQDLCVNHFSISTLSNTTEFCVKKFTKLPSLPLPLYLIIRCQPAPASAFKFIFWTVISIFFCDGEAGVTASEVQPSRMGHLQSA